jgi:transketolase
MEIQDLKLQAQKIRCSIIQEISAAGSGHPGGSLSATDIVTALFFNVMNIDPADPAKPDRDRFVLSKGHAAPVLYAALAHKGYFPLEELSTLRKINSRLQGHPSMRKLPGVEMSTGSLGQGFSASIGMALAGRLDKNPGRIYVLLGDGELQEGLVWEAAMAGGHYALDNLTAIVDWNGLQIDGRNDDVMTVRPIDKKFEAFGWNVLSIDGHDMAQILDALETAKNTKGRPTMILAGTHKGKGVSFMEDQSDWHGKAPGEDDTKRALEELGGEAK